MKKFLLPIMSLFLIGTVSSQGFMADAVNPGSVYRETKLENVSGSPLMFDTWQPAKVKIAKGKMITGVLVNFDLIKQKPIYFFNDQSYEFLDELSSIQVNFESTKGSQLFLPGFAHKDFSPSTFVEVLNEGNTKLLKWTKKVIIEERGYGANVLNKIIEPVTQYYIAKGNNATLIKLGNSALEDAVGPKNWKQVQAYMKQEGLNPKQEKDMAKLLAYSNTLM